MLFDFVEQRTSQFRNRIEGGSLGRGLQCRVELTQTHVFHQLSRPLNQTRVAFEFDENGVLSEVSERLHVFQALVVVWCRFARETVCEKSGGVERVQGSQSELLVIEAFDPNGAICCDEQRALPALLNEALHELAEGVLVVLHTQTQTQHEMKTK